MGLFWLFYGPFALLIIGLVVLFLLLSFEVKMVTEVVENHDLSRISKFLWTLAMVPFLPITAAAYYVSTHLRHTHNQHYNY